DCSRQRLADRLPERHTQLPKQHGGPTVRIVSRGAEPRAPLRFQFQAGKPITAKFDMSMKMKASMGTGPMPSMPIPGMSLTTVTEISRVNPDNSASISSRLVQFRIGNQMVLGSSTTKETDPNDEFRWDYTQTDLGTIHGLSSKLPRNLDPSLMQQLNQVQGGLQDSSVIFPEEPVGAEARWEVAFPEAASRGIKTRKTVTYTLTSRSESSATFTVSVRETATNQAIDNLPGMLPGMSATLNSLDVTSSGQMRVDLTSSAAKGSLSGRVNQSVSVSPSAELGASPIKMTVQLEIETQFSTLNGNFAENDSLVVAKPVSIDLTDFVNTPFSSMIRTEDETFEFPSPLEVNDGVQFKVTGLVQLAGLAANPITSRLPDRVTGIKVQRKCRRIHFLHAAGPGGRPDEGTRIGSYLVRFSNGESIELPIIYGKNLRSWWGFPGEPPQATNAEVSWTTMSSGTPVRLFVNTWENPKPNVEISSVDVVANIARAGLFLAGVTAE
ncbi:MAG: hypothetical protein O2960_28210, partial [Verrucomicrobia bacterium]|nr:hypothetical protein [Verrucomicrobiota bacterium]